MRSTRLRGARTNNLRGVDLDLEPGTLVAIAGPSGAGKSSLAFGTLYAEGQRRYVESFSAYARQFLERLGRPPVDELDPVPVGIAVDRQAPVRSSRSTVGTMTEIADYAKTLWARAAELHCPRCERKVTSDAPSRAAEAVLEQARDARVVITYPVPVHDAEHFVGVREELARAGYRRVWLGESVRDLDGVPPSEVVAAPVKKPAKKTKRSKSPAPATGSVLEVVADRAVARESERSRLVEALEAAMRLGHGRADVRVEGGEVLRFASGLSCAHCGLSFREPTPGLFSYNSPIGACESCRGFGRTIGIDWERVIPDRKATLANDAIRAWHGKSMAWERRQLKRHAALAGIPMDVPLASFDEAQWNWLLSGDGIGWPKGWWGLRTWFEWKEARAYKMHVRVFLARYRKYETCAACRGTRLKPDALCYRVGNVSLPDFYAMPIDRTLAFLEGLAPKAAHDPAFATVLDECRRRLAALSDVGLEYLSLDRASRTLSGGEAQRVALTSALGASLTSAMFVLDEPTVGLHPRDVERLSAVVRRLVHGDNVAVVVEHDPAMLRAADRVIELGPGAGEHGGEIVFDGKPRELARAATATGRALRGGAPIRRDRRRGRGTLKLVGATGHNLKGIDLELPLGAVTVVTGVSGSGKSSLVFETLLPATLRALGKTTSEAPLPFVSLSGTSGIADVIGVDQAPLGRTSRGNPATYLKAWDIVRKRFASQPLATERGYGPGTFSFNVAGGRCEACKGEGAETVEMQFLADVSFSCPECHGRRFVGPVLDVRWGEANVAEVLDLTAREMLERYPDDAELARCLSPLVGIGLGYLRLGQPLSTLSGGEAQRLKLALALKSAAPGSLLVLDEPTAGLHAEDIAPLLATLDRLVERGDTIVIVEHDMRVAASADHLVDLGPGAGEAGGTVVASGTPEEVAASSSVTARFLKDALAAAEGDEAKGKVPRLRSTSTAADAPGAIEIVGAREHNLKNVTVSIPREKLVVVTGPSGSGKSTLAFDVLFAEGQRRYLETLSPYARQYMPQLPRPSVDRVVGVPPSVSLEQRITRGGANSTVATITEVAHYLRLLWARAGLLHCVDCRVPIAPRTAAALASDVRKRFGGRRELVLLAPIVRGRKGVHREVLDRARKEGLSEARIDGEMMRLVPGLGLSRFVEHDVDLVVARLRSSDAALETELARTLKKGEGTAKILTEGEELLVSSRRACPKCGTGYPELDPRFFSFNTRQGACATCEGHGQVVREVGRGEKRREEATPCTACDGTRLSPLARAVTVDGRGIVDVLSMRVEEATRSLPSVALRGRDATIGKVPLAEAVRRLAFLSEVGLGYLGLDRSAATLSGGEMQRVRLSAQLGSGLTGVLYVLDEPTIGLHPRDTGKLIEALRALVDRGNSVVVVEHDEDMIRAADHLLDVGPGGGHHGGNVLAAGSPRALLADPSSVTGRALSRPLPVPPKRRPLDERTSWLSVLGAKEHNLKDIDVRMPLGTLTVVTGVSGSGKSTLVRNILLPATRRALGLVGDSPGAHRGIEGFAPLRRAIEIDQSPIGRTPRSVPATYVGIWDEIRKLLAGRPEARARGFQASRFSFNVAEGRCPACEGQGALSVEMAFLPDVLVPCDECRGLRFDRETLSVRWHERNAGELLELEVEEAVSLFASVPRVRAPLELLVELGLGYLKLGQASNTLSGGEAQRLKLVSELGSERAGPTLYVMDEPTTGLHRDDVARLLTVLDRLVARGDTVICIEHHPDVMVAADYIVDLGPEGGAGGGRVVAEGRPEVIAKKKGSHTGAVLRAGLAKTLYRDSVEVRRV